METKRSQEHNCVATQQTWKWTHLCPFDLHTAQPYHSTRDSYVTAQVLSGRSDLPFLHNPPVDLMRLILESRLGRLDSNWDNVPQPGPALSPDTATWHACGERKNTCVK